MVEVDYMNYYVIIIFCEKNYLMRNNSLSMNINFITWKIKDKNNEFIYNSYVDDDNIKIK